MMAASVVNPSNVTPPHKSQDTLANTSASPARPLVARSASSTGANPPGVSHTNSSELGVPGSFPRNPRLALDHLSDQAAVAGTETTKDNENVMTSTSATQDFRHVVGVAASYLPGSVVDAFGSVFRMSLPSIVKSMCSQFYFAIFGVSDVVAVGSTDSEKAEKELHRGDGSESAGQKSATGMSASHASQKRTSRFDPKDLAIAGIAVPDFGKKSESTGEVSDLPVEEQQTTGQLRKSRFNPRDLAVGGIASSDFIPSSSKSRISSSSGVAAEDSSNSASEHSQVAKEKRDNDVNSSSLVQPTSHGQTRDLRKKAIEGAALGAGIGTLSGTTAYKNSRDAQFQNSASSPSRNGGQNIQESSKAAQHRLRESPSQAQSSDSAGKSVNNDEGAEELAFASYVPAPVITEDTPLPLDAPGKYEEEEKDVSPSTEKAAHTGTGGQNAISEGKDVDPDGKLKKAAETGPMGAGAGALGGAAYEHYRDDDKTLVPSQREGQPRGGVADKSADSQAPAATTVSECGTTPQRGRDTSSKILGTSSASGLRHPTQAAHSSSRSADTEAQPDTTASATADSKAKEGEQRKNDLGAGAVGAGIGAGGTALYAHSRHQQDSAQPRYESNAQGPPRNAETGAPSGYGTAEGAPTPGDSAKRGSPGEELTSQSQTRSQDKEKENAVAATGVGAGAVGTAAVLDKDKAAEKERYQKEHLKRQQEKEAEKREKEAKKYEKDVAAAAAASDKKAHKAAEKEKEEQKRHEKEQKDVEKEREKREKEARHKKEVAAAAAVGGAGAAGIAGNKLAKDQDKPRSGEGQEGFSKETPSGSDPSSQQPPVHPSIKAASAGPERPHVTPLPGAAGPNQPAKSGADSDFPLPSESFHDKEELGEGTKPERVPAVDLDGTGKGASPGTGAAGTGSGVGAGAAGAAYAFKPGRSKGDAERERDASKSPESRSKSLEKNAGDKERSRYYGTEGLQEKHGGILKSTTVDRKKVEEEGGRKSMGSNSSGGQGGQGSPSGGNGNGKKEGFVKHIVEKVKDKLHHHD